MLTEWMKKQQNTDKLKKILCDFLFLFPTLKHVGVLISLTQQHC